MDVGHGAARAGGELQARVAGEASGAAAGAAGWGTEEEDGFVLSTAASGAVLGFEGGSPAVIVLLSN